MSELAAVTSFVADRFNANLEYGGGNRPVWKRLFAIGCVSVEFGVADDDCPMTDHYGTLMDHTEACVASFKLRNSSAILVHLPTGATLKGMDSYGRNVWRDSRGRIVAEPEWTDWCRDEYDWCLCDNGQTRAEAVRDANHLRRYGDSWSLASFGVRVVVNGVELGSGWVGGVELGCYSDDNREYVQGTLRELAREALQTARTRARELAPVLGAIHE